MECPMATACGAKTTSGEPCKRAPSKGKSRCKLHGGASTGPKENRADISGNQYSKIHGIYGTCLTDEERQDAASIEIGNLDAAIRLAHIQLKRALTAKSAAQSKPELEEVITSENGQTHKQRVIDYDTKIDKCMARIGSLEMQRKTLMEKTDDGVLHLNITGGMQD
jgi:hypothetical protein